MKTAILGFNQAKAVEAGLTCDELVFLDWFVYFYTSDHMNKVQRGGQLFGWVNRAYVREQLPILRLNRDERVSEFLKRLTDKGFIDRVTEANEYNRGKRSLFRPTAKCYELTSDKADSPAQQADHERKSVAEHDHIRNSVRETERPHTEIRTSHTPSIKNTPTSKSASLSSTCGKDGGKGKKTNAHFELVALIESLHYESTREEIQPESGKEKEIGYYVSQLRKEYTPEDIRKRLELYYREKMTFHSGIHRSVSDFYENYDKCTQDNIHRDLYCQNCGKLKVATGNECLHCHWEGDFAPSKPTSPPHRIPERLQAWTREEEAEIAAKLAAYRAKAS